SGWAKRTPTPTRTRPTTKTWGCRENRPWTHSPAPVQFWALARMLAPVASTRRTVVTAPTLRRVVVEHAAVEAKAKEMKRILRNAPLQRRAGCKRHAVGRRPVVPDTSVENPQRSAVGGTTPCGARGQSVGSTAGVPAHAVAGLTTTAPPAAAPEAL